MMNHRKLWVLLYRCPSEELLSYNMGGGYSIEVVCLPPHRAAPVTIIAAASAKSKRERNNNMEANKGKWK